MLQHSSFARQVHQRISQAASSQTVVDVEPYDPDPILDSRQAARRLHIHPKTLQRYARQGHVKGFQIGTMWRFRSSDLDRWIAEQVG